MDESWNNYDHIIKRLALVLFSAKKHEVEGLLLDLNYAEPLDDAYNADWCYPNRLDPVLNIEIYSLDDYKNHGVPQDYYSIRSMLDRDPTLYILVEVSERHAGGPEMRKLAIDVFSKFDGVAFDNSYYDYWWVLKVVKDKDTPDGYLYFDYDTRFQIKRKSIQ